MGHAYYGKLGKHWWFWQWEHIQVWTNKLKSEEYRLDLRKSYKIRAKFQHNNESTRKNRRIKKIRRGKEKKGARSKGNDGEGIKYRYLDSCKRKEVFALTWEIRRFNDSTFYRWEVWWVC